MGPIELYALWKVLALVGSIVGFVWLGMIVGRLGACKKHLASIDESLKQLPAVRRHDFQKSNGQRAA